MRSKALASLFVLALAACGGAGAPGSPSPAGLVISMPAAPAAFVKSDTLEVEVDTGMMGTMNMTGSSDARIGLTFAEAAAGFTATAVYESLEARMDNPMGGAATVTESDLDGELVFTVDSRGNATVTDRFQVGGQAAQMVGNAALAYEFFLRIPDRQVGIGDSWVDTLSVDETQEGITSTTTTVTTYTVEADTVVAGAPMWRISQASDIEVVAEGTMQGMSMSQIMSGTSTGSLLWDLGTSLLYQSASVTELSGTMAVDMPGAPDMGMSLVSRSHTARAAN